MDGYPNYSLQQYYNGDGLRVKKVDNGTATYYVRSTVLGGQVVAEVNWQGTWDRGYVYMNGQLLLVQSGGVPKWVHQDPVTKSQRLTDYYGNLQAVVDLDPWGGETTRSWQQGQQPQRYTSYVGLAHLSVPAPRTFQCQELSSRVSAATT